MDKIEITKDLIRILAFYGIVQDWDIDKLKDTFEYLELPADLVNDTLNEGAE